QEPHSEEGDPRPPVEVLVEKGKREKQLNEEEIIALFDDPEGDEIQALFDRLEALGIEIISDDNGADDFEAEPDEDELEEIEDEDGDDDDLVSLDSAALSDDPVRMYLKEIGQVPLLDSNRE